MVSQGKKRALVEAHERYMKSGEFNKFVRKRKKNVASSDAPEYNTKKVKHESNNDSEGTKSTKGPNNKLRKSFGKKPRTTFGIGRK